MNKIMIHGRLARDPELKTTNNGIEVCSFTVAVDRPVKSKDGERQSDFFSCTAWRQGAAFVNKYFHKGDGIIIEGSMQSRQYEKDGQKRTAWDLMVDRIEFPAAKKSDNGGNGGFIPVEDDGEMPF